MTATPMLPRLIGLRLGSAAICLAFATRGAALNVYTTEASQGLFTQFGLSSEVGAVWQPRSFNMRLALAAALPVYAGSIQSSCDPTSCYGCILPQQAISPWVVVLGTGWRLAHSSWNEPVHTRFRDELHLTVGLRTYWEPARYADVRGRLHGTAGAEFRVLWLHLRHEEYRLSSSLAGDFAPRYENAGASLGLWN